ncbi:hypothetical protein [Cupriavidus sp. D39]|uniref:hypothetical protein n=1 Tax=Cupriavidus sp. D39 TaxID=2997877 RepID=UPI00226E9B10|nr:hypothetical protein [Cupriavidus sp. D39]MCY0855310.1 hypothetical protein [Cupriavidus sp. D39]
MCKAPGFSPSGLTGLGAFEVPALYKGVMHGAMVKLAMDFALREGSASTPMTRAIVPRILFRVDGAARLVDGPDVATSPDL